MSIRTTVVSSLLAGVFLLSAFGCFSPAPQGDTNQAFPLISWGAKAASGNLTSTTSQEWQAAVDKIASTTGHPNLSLTDEQADAVVAFLVENNLNSFAEIKQLIDDVAADPNLAEEIVVPDGLAALYEDGLDLDAFAGQLGT